MADVNNICCWKHFISQVRFSQTFANVCLKRQVELRYSRRQLWSLASASACDCWATAMLLYFRLFCVVICITESRYTEGEDIQAGIFYFLEHFWKLCQKLDETMVKFFNRHVLGIVYLNW